MTCVYIDNQPVEVSPGASVLEATRVAGHDLPALCHLDGCDANASCLCCLVRIEGRAGAVPACAATVSEGMRIACQTPDLRQLRKLAIELLLSDHVGECHAPCQNTCPARMDIPDMMRHIAAGRDDLAIAAIKRSIPMPATLGRVCPEVCEKACRRAQLDQPAAICQLKRAVADRDLASPHPYVPPQAPQSGQSVAIVGGGPTGLSAAHHLLCAGHRVTIFEAEDQLGGRLRRQFSREELPAEVLDAEIALILRLGASAACNRRVGVDVTLEELCSAYDAIIVAAGELQPEQAARLGLAADGGRLQVDATTRQTSRPRVYAGGQSVRPNKLVIYSVAEGERVARAADAALCGRPPASHKPFESRRPRYSSDEVKLLRQSVAERPRLSAHQLPILEAVRDEAARCLACDCASADNCKLRFYADAYECDADRFRGDKRRLAPCLEGRHAMLEHGKCIACGICVQIARKMGEPIGLSFHGRGFDVAISVPLGHSLDEALTHSTSACIAACPTGALSAPRRNSAVDADDPPPCTSEKHSCQSV
ncbi:MAG: glutamate synthase [Planctomycetota bacterium]|nr:MAG: glutamate synthase [Planctomycetota bacterium]